MHVGKQTQPSLASDSDDVFQDIVSFQKKASKRTGKYKT